MMDEQQNSGYKGSWKEVNFEIKGDPNTLLDVELVYHPEFQKRQKTRMVVMNIVMCPVMFVVCVGYVP